MANDTIDNDAPRQRRSPKPKRNGIRNLAKNNSRGKPKTKPVRLAGWVSEQEQEQQQEQEQPGEEEADWGRAKDDNNNSCNNNNNNNNNVDVNVDEDNRQ
ncbi:hypothetical protein AWZ03_013241 [Drosophila navojoa]|uniref:Uncharacterized protein n=1 Tax=Drosophila navojoa TaxID=7232 RepID=A0A484AUQ1_DRONA|nr:hypothetical protein AWZ03_013241 [Drosophila navojoa]